ELARRDAARAASASGERARRVRPFVSPSPARGRSSVVVRTHMWWALALALVAGLVVCAAASADKEKVQIAAADQALAKNALVRLGDLGNPVGWSGGQSTPTPPTSFRCGSYVARQSDLVLTGNAAAKWMHSGLEIDSEAQVLRSSSMVALDWQRTVTHAGVVDCMRQKFASGLPKGQKLVSFGAVTFPKVAQRSAAFRGLVDVDTGK